MLFYIRNSVQSYTSQGLLTNKHERFTLFGKNMVLVGEEEREEERGGEKKREEERGREREAEM